MCLIHLTTHPCGHTVEVACDQCAAAQRLRPCRPQSITSLHRGNPDRPNGASGHPTICPCTQKPSFFSGYPLDPQGFAEFCVSKDIPIESVVAMVPSWIFKPDGRMIGTVTTPWRVTDYIVEYYCCRNPRATRGVKKISTGMVVKREVQGPGAGYERQDGEGDGGRKGVKVEQPVGLGDGPSMFGGEAAVVSLQTQDTCALKIEPEGTRAT